MGTARRWGNDTGSVSIVLRTKLLGCYALRRLVLRNRRGRVDPQVRDLDLGCMHSLKYIDAARHTFTVASSYHTH